MYLRLHQCGTLNLLKDHSKHVFQRSEHGIEDVTVEELVYNLRRLDPTTVVPETVQVEILEIIHLLYVQFCRHEKLE
jgi:hypothetical protein